MKMYVFFFVFLKCVLQAIFRKICGTHFFVKGKITSGYDTTIIILHRTSSTFGFSIMKTSVDI